MYKFKTVLSVVCVICSIINIIGSIVLWNEELYGVVGLLSAILWIIAAINIAYSAREDYLDYTFEQEYIKENYFDRLSHMFKKHYWKIDVDQLVPIYTEKKKVLEWAVDVSMACKAYIHDYNTKETDIKLHCDLELMIELAQNLIDNKKYI